MGECKIRHGEGYISLGRYVKGFYVTIPNSMGSTESFVEHLSDAFAMVGKYDNEAEEIKRAAKRIGDYLSSDEGKWGRQDTF